MDTMIPAAQWSESDEGARSLVATSGEARAELEPPQDGKGEAYLMVSESGYHGGTLLSADAARATIAVLHRWLAERAPRDEGPALEIAVGSEPEGMERVCDSMRDYRGWRYIRVGERWCRTRQPQEIST